MLCRSLALMVVCFLVVGTVGVAETQTESESEPQGLRLRLEGVEDSSGAEPASDEGGHPPVVETLSTEAVAALLARAGALNAGGGDEPSFSYLSTSLPAPITGELHVEPPLDPSAGSSVAPSVAPDAPLEVLRFAPEGEVPIAPQLCVTFSQPMVPLATHAMLAAHEVPVQLSPAVDGGWRWIGTRTLLFEPEGRLPMATAYSVEIPAGTRSATGGVLEQAVRWQFATPAPRLLAQLPSGDSAARQPVLLLAFDQRVDPSVVLEVTRAEVLGFLWNEEVALRLATPEELAADEDAARLVEQWDPGRWVSLIPVEPLPLGADMRIRLPSGLASAEGPLRTRSAQAFEYQVHGPLTVRRIGHGGPVYPRSTVAVHFSNQLDPASITPEDVSLEPPAGELQLSVNRHELFIRGATRSGVTYHVTLGKGLTDVWGQSLEEARRVSFTVRPFEPGFRVPASEFSVLDPYDLPVFRVQTVNMDELEVEVRTVHPDELMMFPGSWTSLEKGDVILPGRRLLTETLDLEPGAREWRDRQRETVIDLGAAFPDDLGHAVVILRGEVYGGRGASMHWVQRTQLAVDAVVDGERMLCWVTRLKDGSPVSGARVALSGEVMGETVVAGLTDAEGLAVLALPEGEQRKRVLSAQLGEDVVLLPESRWAWRSDSTTQWRRRPFHERELFSLFDDRGLYRPGETVRIKGWVRRTLFAPHGDVSGLPLAGTQRVAWSFQDSRRVEIGAGTAPLDVFGGFDLEVPLPRDINLGRARCSVVLEGEASRGSTGRLDVQVQDYRTPEYEVSVSARGGPHLVGGDALLTAAATYHSGGGLRDAPVRWTVSSTPGRFTPAGWSGWTFGEWVPWWRYESQHARGGYGSSHGDPQSWSFEGQTDEAGEHQVRAVFESVDPPRPMNVSVEAAVTDVNQQQWVGATTLLVQPSSLCVGLRSGRGFVRLGESFPLEVVVTDLDGQPAAARQVALRAWRMEAVQRDGAWVTESRDLVEQVIASGGEPVATEWTPVAGGNWTVEATVLDDEGRSHRSSQQFWVSGGDAPSSTRLEYEDLVLVPDRREYAPGEAAQVLVVAPFAGGEGLATLERNGIVEEQRFAMDGTTHTLAVSIAEGMFPDVQLQVDVVGQAPRTDESGAVLGDQPPRPAYAGGLLRLAVPPERRRLTVDVTPALPVLQPGQGTSAEVLVTDADGEPVADASVALVVVDEAVLSLTGHQITNPLDVFYPECNTGTSLERLRDFVRLSERMTRWPDGRGDGSDGLRYGDARGLTLPGDEDLLEESEGGQSLAALGYLGGDDYESSGRRMASYGRMAPASMPPARTASGDVAGGATPELIATRSNFSALAVFAPATTTDVEGRVRVPFTLPDSLTRYRLRAVAVDRNRRAGLGESTLTARLPLMVRPSAPRFLNDGDEFDLPVVLHNRTARAMDVELAADAVGLRLPGPRGYRVTVPAEDRVELSLPAEAARSGTARVLLVVSQTAPPATSSATIATLAHDAARITVPIRTPITSEAFAVYGQLDEGAVRQPVERPVGVRPDYGGLQLTTSSTALSALTDAVLGVALYPYGCSEQRASRVLTVAALQDVLSAFAADGMPSPEELAESVRADVAFLESIQQSDGSFAFWSRNGRPSVFVSLHVAHALLAAQARGFALPRLMLNRSMRYLSEVDALIDENPEEWSPRVRNTLKAYALRVRALHGEDVLDDARRLAQQGHDELSMEAIGWLLAAVGDDPVGEKETARLLRRVMNGVTETAGKAGFASGYSDGAYVLLYGDNRTDGVVLDALLVADPESDLIPKVVAGLLAHRTAGQWGSTQENVFALLALSRYFRLFESETPDFVARAWWDGRQAVEQVFQGRSADRTRVDLPMSELLAPGGGASPTRPAADPGAEPAADPGELILSKQGMGRLYYRLGLRSAPLGFDQSPLDAGFTVTRVYEALDDPADVRRADDGRWIVRRGARVRVRLCLVATAERHHVALVDALPGGLEVLNPELSSTGSLPVDAPISMRGYMPWSSRWFQHQNLRDERAEAFTTLLRPGVYNWSYVARATTTGTFMVPPPKAEEMYAPETFGRGATDRVVVE